MGSGILDKCYETLPQQKKIILKNFLSDIRFSFLSSCHRLSQTHRQQSSSQTTMKTLS